MKILGIETSCDETAVAIIDEQKNILAHVLNSQIELHKKFGGVVPELAARGHVEVLDDLILQALSDANLKFEDIDGFAATSGPGLIGGVIVGMMAAKTLASVFQKPFIAVNHLEAAKGFAGNIARLRKAGADESVISEIVGMGPAQGNIVAKGLLGSGKLSEYLNLRKGLYNTGASVGAEASMGTQNTYEINITKAVISASDIIREIKAYEKKTGTKYLVKN